MPLIPVKSYKKGLVFLVANILKDQKSSYKASKDVFTIAYPI